MGNTAQNMLRSKPVDVDGLVNLTVGSVGRIPQYFGMQCSSPGTSRTGVAHIYYAL
jgi:hypothetical protein